MNGPLTRRVLAAPAVAGPRRKSTAAIIPLVDVLVLDGGRAEAGLVGLVEEAFAGHPWYRRRNGGRCGLVSPSKEAMRRARRL